MASTSPEKPVNAASGSELDPNSEDTGPGSASSSTSGAAGGVSAAGASGGGATPSWSAEFKKRRGAFETVSEGEDGGGVFEYPAELTARERRLRELAAAQVPLMEPGLDFRRPRHPSDSGSSTRSRDSTGSAMRSPMGQSSYSHPPPVPHPPSDPPEESRSSRVSINGQRYLADDDDDDDALAPLGMAPPRHPNPPNNTQRVLAIGEETGQKERVVPYTAATPAAGSAQSTGAGPGPSPAGARREQSDEDEREDSRLSQQIALLTAKNQQLQKQLEDRELERNRLREQLDVQRVDKGPRSIYSPPGLPSRVLDGRKVLRDSVPLVTSPGIPASASPVPRPQSPLSVHGMVSPLPPPSVSPGPAPFSHSSRSSGGKDNEGASGGKRAGSSSSVEEFVMPRAEASAPLQQQVGVLKRSNFELEKRLHELAEENRRLESELTVQRENFAKMQAREQDLLKDIEVLRDENSHHTGAIRRLQGEREGLKSENESLQDEMGTLNDKLNKTEKYYKEVEHENLSLEAEIKDLIANKNLLIREKQELQVAVENALKTKENFRSTIKQLREENQPKAAAAKPEKKKVVIPVSKEQKELSEVMNLRKEKLQLQDRLLVAQQEIDSLEAHLKVADNSDDLTSEPPASLTSEPQTTLTSDSQTSLTSDPKVHDDEVRSKVSAAHSQVSTVRSDLNSVRSAVSLLTSQQHVLARESFVSLVSQCRERLSSVEKDKGRLSETLEQTEQSLAKIQEDFEVVKSENAKLRTQKDAMLGDVSALKEEIAKLQDQKRMQSVQISQNEAIAREKDEKLEELTKKQKQLQERYSTSERNWKREYGKLEMEWEGKVAEALQSCELLSEEKDTLTAEKNRLEAKLTEVSQDNQQLSTSKQELEAQITFLEEKMVQTILRADENERTICEAQEEVASTLIQKAILSAQLTLDQEKFERIAESEGEREQELSDSQNEARALRESLGTLRGENTNLLRRLEEIASKEQHINTLESKILLLTTNQTQLQSEMDIMTKKHSKVVQEFRVLEDSEHARRLDNEMLKMTLTTEIKLLKSKLSSVNEEKSRLEQKLAEIAAEHPPSAFHAVPGGSKPVDPRKKQLAPPSSQQGDQRRMPHDVRTNQQQSSQHLKDPGHSKGTSSSNPAPSSHISTLDEEAVSTLRKKLTDMTRKTFFLESDRKTLTDKVRSLTASLKSARESKDHMTSEHVQRLQEENRALRERVHGLEGNLTRRLMAADSRIVETVKENDKLRQKLVAIKSALSAKDLESSGLESFLTLLKSESKVLQDLKTSLAASNSELEKLAVGHQRIEGLHQEIQLSLVADEQSPTEPATSPVGRGVPAVFKSLPAGYISNLQGQKERRERDRPSSAGKAGSTRSLSIGSATTNPELQRKLSEITSITSAFGESFQRHRHSLKQKDEEVGSIQERLDSLEGKFRSENERSQALKDTLAGIHGLEVHGEQLQLVMQRQIEQLQDQVIDRDSALSDIETQMKADFELHHKKFTTMKSQVIELREQLSTSNDQLRSKDQYIQKTEEHCLNLQSELFKLRKEMERVVSEQKELMMAGLSEGMQLQGVSSVADMFRYQREELSQLQKLLRDFTRELSQVQSQLESVQREKSVLQSKAIEMERMHIQMKEHMGSDINYLRQLNLQLVEQQMKAGKATEILKEVKEAQKVFKQQRDMIRMESELDASKTKLLEQSHKITELESQLAGQALSLKILRAEKDHSVLLTHHTPELTNQITAMHMRPRSAESARKPKYKISDFKPRMMGPSGRNMNSEFSIVLPSHNPTYGGNAGVDILNLEEQPEPESPQRTLSLGPMVVTDDEYSINQERGKTISGAANTSKHQRCMKLKRGHRRTASTGSNIVPVSVKEKESVGPKSSNPITGTFSGAKTLLHPLKISGMMAGGGGGGVGVGGKQKGLVKYPRPGSADSSRSQDIHTHVHHTRQASGVRVHPTEQLTKTAHEVSEYMHKMIDDHAHRGHDNRDRHHGSAATTDIKESKVDHKDSSGRAMTHQGSGGTLKSSSAGKVKGRFEVARNKLANKSTDSNETTSSEGNGFSSKGSSQSDSSGPRQDAKRSSDFTHREDVGGGRPVGVNVGGGAFSQRKAEPTDLSRTESMSSTCSTLSIFGTSNLPSRNHSFTYDGGESSTYSHESLEIGDSVENLQALGKLGGNPYFTPIMPSEVYTTSSSDDENYRKNRRKKSATTGDHTPRHNKGKGVASREGEELQGGEVCFSAPKLTQRPGEPITPLRRQLAGQYGHRIAVLKDTSYHSTSSGDLDTLEHDSYRGNRDGNKKLGDIPVHVNESISISDMDRDTTDIEMDQKAADLQHCFGRVRYSSTGSVKICYSESGTSMEDISRN